MQFYLAEKHCFSIFHNTLKFIRLRITKVEESVAIYRQRKIVVFYKTFLKKESFHFMRHFGPNVGHNIFDKY